MFVFHSPKQLTLYFWVLWASEERYGGGRFVSWGFRAPSGRLCRTALVDVIERERAKHTPCRVRTSWQEPEENEGDLQTRRLLWICVWVLLASRRQRKLNEAFFCEHLVSNHWLLELEAAGIRGKVLQEDTSW